MKLILIIPFYIQAAPLNDFNLEVFNKENEVVSLDQYKGKKVYINFWASWCLSCIKELPELEELKLKYPEVVFLAINAGEKPSKIKRFLRKYKFSFKILLDKERKYSKGIGVFSLPQSIVIDGSKEILYRGAIPPEKL